MLAHLYWEETVRRKQIEKAAYHLAESIHKEFKEKQYGTPSYFHSLAERFASLVKEEKWEKERKRNKVKAYWETENGEGIPFYKRIEEIFDPDYIENEFDAGAGQYEYAELLEIASAYFWSFLADFLKMEEEKTDGKEV
ncbi:hypothetical protein QT238_13885 [Geobacillus stearothermophilus]|nr:hypothetical protein QT238_13885 [Geobacillus stearothermophilus]